MERTGGVTKIPRRWQIPAEIALVFAVFFVEGAWPVPEVNEPNYLGKAIHFWDPAWAQNDFFLGTADTHWVFYFTFGWLSRWLASDGAWRGPAGCRPGACWPGRGGD